MGKRIFTYILMMITQKFYMLCREKANPSAMMTEGMCVLMHYLPGLPKNVAANSARKLKEVEQLPK